MTQQRATLLTRSIRRTGIVLTTVATGLFAIGLVIGGAQAIASRAVSIAVEDPAPPVSVRTLRLEVVPGFTTSRNFIGQLEAPRTVNVGFEQGGTLADVLVDEGDRVQAGQVIARLDTRALVAERAARSAALEALSARAELARLTLDRQAELERRGFSATQAFDQARLGEAELSARLAEAEAAITLVDVALDKATIRAPFDGVIGARAADPGATLGAGQPVASVLENTAPQMRLGLPADLARDLAPGTGLDVWIGGERFPSSVTSLRPDLDPGTRTQSLLLTLDMPTGSQPPFGQTGRVTIDRFVETPGTWVPLSALEEGTRGLWTVLVIDEPAGTVVREAVEVLHAESDRAFVRGTFKPGALAVAAGPHRVVPGQPILIAGN